MEENEKIEEKTTVDNESRTEIVEDVVAEEVVNNDEKQESKALSIASLVLGIVSLVCMKTGLIALACAILAIVFGVKGKKRAGQGMAKAGMILGIISVSLFALGFILITIVGVGLGAALFSAAM